MSDLISRQALCDDLREYKVYPVPISSDESEVKGYNDGIDLAISVIAKFPSAEPERKRGKWEVQLSTGDDRPFIWWKCSVCGHVIFSETERDRREFHAFCSRCGADMRGE